MDTTTPPAKPATKRGGARPGAGRPRLYAAGLHRTVVYLTGAQLGALTRIGPDLSSALRQVLDESGYV
jgi:hypothetical protein